MKPTIVRARVAAALLACAACGLAPTNEPPARNDSPGGGTTVDGAPTPTSGGDATNPPFPGYHLAWSDEFDGGALDGTKWNVQTGPGRGSLLGADALEVRNGVLAFMTYTDGNGHHTAYLNTLGKLEAQYGYFEARIRLRTQPGEWCAFWNISPSIGNPLGDPGKAGTEIDIVEHRYVDDYGWELKDLLQIGVNWDGFGAGWKKDNVTLGLPGGAPLYGEWHTYAVLWDENGYTFYVDEQPLWATSKAVSHHAHAVYLSCEVLDANWAGFVPPGGYGPRGAGPPHMEVDWVRVWQQAQ